MKKAIFFLILYLLYSCSLLETNNIAPGYSEAFFTIKSALFGEPENQQINRELIDAIPYASMLMRIGNGPEGLMILESISRDKLTWVSADGVRLVMQNGKIISSSGLINNLKEIRLPKKINNKNWLTDRLNQESFNSYYSFSQPTLIDLKVEHQLSPANSDNIEILGIKKNAELVTETIENQKIGWKYLNKYWIDKDNFIWKSEQKLTPKLPVIYYSVTKKPSK